jgi:beta-alanine degradation protein BauB
MCGSARMEVIANNDRVRILRYTLVPGAETGWHKHETDYVIVPYSDCRVRVDTATGSIEAGMRKDEPYFRTRGVEHNVTSVTSEPFSFLEIEIK